MALYPLGDTTEARYGEVARLMLTGGDWITPRNEPDSPFWAKPPLSFWAQASTMAIFGVNEFGARISSLLFAVGVGWLLLRLARHAPDAHWRDGPWSLLLLATMPLFFVLSGTVMTDMALGLCTTAAMAWLWRAVCAGDRRSGWLLFAALGLGLLAKGPVMLALCATAALLYLALSQDRAATLRQLAARLPWAGGIALMLAIAVPWYAAAESATPGFLKYFLVGEHLLRFIEPAWQGDLYGSAHHAPKGAVWWHLLQAGGIAVGLALVFAHRGAWRRAAGVPAFDRYLLACTLAAPVFFTFASNAIWSYVLPSLPPLALLLARALNRRATPARERTVLVACTVMLVGSAFVALAWLPREAAADMRSTRRLVATIDALAVSSTPDLIAFRQHQHSAKFYSRGRFRKGDHAEVQQALRSQREFFLMIKEFDLSNGQTLEGDLMRQTRRVGRFGEFVLFHKP